MPSSLRKKWLFAPLYLPFLGLIGACMDEKEHSSASYDEVRTIVEANCAGCHTGGASVRALFMFIGSD